MRNIYNLYVFFFFLLALYFDPINAQVDSTAKKSAVFLPIIARSIETNWAFGAVSAFTFKTSRKDSISRTSNLHVASVYSLNKQFISAIEGTQYFKNESFILSEQISYSSFPDKYWGLGNNSEDKNEESYRFKDIYIFLHGMKKISPHFFYGFAYEYQKLWDIEYLNNGLFDIEKVFGRNGYQVSGLGASLTFDNRNNAFYPNRGMYAQLYFSFFTPALASNFSYSAVTLDFRKYIPINNKNILAFQLYSLNNIGREVPLRSLALLGGSAKMRGYYDGRYRDNSSVIFQAENRFSLYKKISMVAFAGLGDVYNRLNNFNLYNLKYSLGIGLRFALIPKEKLNLRIDYGIGSGKNNGFYLQIGEAF